MIAKNGHREDDDAGGMGGGCAAGAIDLAKGKDRELLRRSIVHEWGDLADMMPVYMSALNKSLVIAMNKNDSRRINSCVALLKSIVDQMQKEEHHISGQQLNVDATVTVEYVNRFSTGQTGQGDK